MMKLSDLRTNREVLDDALNDPEFNAEWDRTAVARDLASQVLNFRAERLLSQRALAEMLHMSQPQIARLEAATHNPTIETLSRVADLLDMDLDVIVPPRHGKVTLSTRPARRVKARTSRTDSARSVQREAALEQRRAASA